MAEVKCLECKCPKCYKPPQEEKKCKRCLLVFPISRFYKAGNRHQSSCVSCYNSHRINYYHTTLKKKPKKKTIKKTRLNLLQKLSKEQRDIIRENWDNVPLTEIAELTNIKLYSIYYIKKSGYVNKDFLESTD